MLTVAVVDFVSMRHSPHCGTLICHRLSPADFLYGTLTGVSAGTAPEVIALPNKLKRQTLITEYFSKRIRAA